MKWIGERCPTLAGHVHPFTADPPSVAPYATYAFIDRNPVTHMKGLSGLTMRRVQIDVWDTDDERGSSLAFKICGTKADPGLDQLCDMLAFDAVGDFDAGELAVEHCSCTSPSEAFEIPNDGSESGWFRYSADYIFHYIEG